MRFSLDFERFGRDLGSILKGLGEVWEGFGLLFSGLKPARIQVHRQFHMNGTDFKREL